MPGPGGVRRQASMVRPVGRGLDPSAGCWRQRESPRVATRGRAAAQAFAGRRGRRPLRFARERTVAEGRGGVGAPRPTDGDMETLWGLREQSFPGRRAVGAGHARPGGLRGQPSMVRPVGRGLDPSAEVGGGASLRGASGTPPPTGCPGMGGDGRSRRGGGTPPYGWGYGNARGVYADTRSRAAAR